MNRTSGIGRTVIKHSTLIFSVSEEEEKESNTERVSEEIMAKSFPNLVKQIKSHSSLLCHK